mgnify:CR=1 FL=1
MLRLSDLHVYYGHVQALKGVSLHVPKGAIISLLGANGAGKSTVLKTVSRLAHPKRGEILLEGVNILRKSSSDMVRAGVVHCPENRRVFPLLTVEENLKIGAYVRRDYAEIRRDLERVYGYFPRLKERARQKAGTLSGGEQQMLAIGRSLMGKPKLLLLDEPSLGIAPIIVRELFEIIRSIHREGTSILLVEQNAHMALEISNYAYLLENGRVAMEGPASELKNNDDVRKLYLGA